MLALILLAAEQNILHGFSGLERYYGPRGSEHAPKLRELARQQAVHRAADAPLQEAQTRRVLELLLQPTQPLRGSAHEALGVTARRLGRPFCFSPGPRGLAMTRNSRSLSKRSGDNTSNDREANRHNP